MPYPLPLTRTEAYLAYKAGVIQQSDLKPSLAVPRNGIDAWLAYWTGLAADYPKREDGTPHILQEEEAYIAYLCGVIDTYPEKCLRRVGAYLRYLISARWGRPDHPLNREELYLSLIKTQVIPSGDPSSDIVIDGTAKAPFQDVKMYGDTFQRTYTGKNLYNAEAIPYVAKRAYGSDGSVLSWTGYAGTNEYQPVEPNTEYTLWNDKIGNTTYLCEYDENKNFIQRLIAVKTFTTTATTKYLRWSLNVGNGEIPPTQTQLELGSTATAYEPYVGGTHSPNPSYPRPIQTVTGEQTVEIVGKNLFDETATPWVKGVAYNTAGLQYWSGYYGITGYQPVEASTQYTFSNDLNKPIHYGIAYYDLGKTLISTTVSDTTTFTTPANCAYIRFAIESSIAPTWAQLELGSTATAYAPYHTTSYPISLGSLELCKLGTYQDYIYKDGSDWKVHKATKKLQLADTTSWVKKANGDFYSENWAEMNGIRSETGFCSHFIYSTTVWYGVGYYGISSTGNLWLITGDATLTGTDSFETWLNTKKPILYHPLATATDTVITDSTLIAQLDSLVNGGAEDGTTYIKVSATDPNLPGLLYVEAPKYE